MPAPAEIKEVTFQGAGRGMPCAGELLYQS